MMLMRVVVDIDDIAVIMGYELHQLLLLMLLRCLSFRFGSVVLTKLTPPPGSVPLTVDDNGLSTIDAAVIATVSSRFFFAFHEIKRKVFLVRHKLLTAEMPALKSFRIEKNVV
jgi:hypothetical protein